MQDGIVGLVGRGGAFRGIELRNLERQNVFMRIVPREIVGDSFFSPYTQRKFLPIQHLFICKVLMVFYARIGNSGNTNLYHNAQSDFRGNFRGLRKLTRRAIYMIVDLFWT